MNSPYGSLDYPTYSPGYDPGWESTPSTDEDFGFDHYGFPTYADEFTSVAEFSTWPSASTAALATPQAQQYHFNQGQQVWSILQTHVQQLPQAASTTNNRGQNNAELMRIPQNGAITPLAGLGISTDSCCTHPCDTADHPSATPENLQALFPSPTLPRIAPPCLYDNNVSPPLQKQNPRFEGDLYAALWVRGEGASRAGWCGFCASWHKLKDSAYWYHLHYTHGIACHSGRPLDPPRKLRRSANALEALCGTCEEWVSIGKGLKMQTTYWRHAYKCSAKGKVRSPRRASAVPDL